MSEIYRKVILVLELEAASQVLNLRIETKSCWNILINLPVRNSFW